LLIRQNLWFLTEVLADQQLSIKGILVGTTSSGDQQLSIKGILVGTTSSGISDQQPSIKGILMGTTNSAAKTCGSYKNSLDRKLLICQNLCFVPGFPS
jgi:hypothetical protein